MVDDKLRADADAGKRAQVLRDELADVFGEIEADAVSTWKKSDARDAEGRELSWSLVRALELLRTRIQRRIDNGKIAEKQIAELNAAQT